MQPIIIFTSSSDRQTDIKNRTLLSYCCCLLNRVSTLTTATEQFFLHGSQYFRCLSRETIPIWEEFTEYLKVFQSVKMCSEICLAQLLKVVDPPKRIPLVWPSVVGFSPVTVWKSALENMENLNICLEFKGNFEVLLLLIVALLLMCTHQSGNKNPRAWMKLLFEERLHLVVKEDTDQ